MFTGGLDMLSFALNKGHIKSFLIISNILRVITRPCNSRVSLKALKTEQSREKQAQHSWKQPSFLMVYTLKRFFIPKVWDTYVMGNSSHLADWNSSSGLKIAILTWSQPCFDIYLDQPKVISFRTYVSIHIQVAPLAVDKLVENNFLHFFLRSIAAFILVKDH